jgi:hypothetical protein
MGEAVAINLISNLFEAHKKTLIVKQSVTRARMAPQGDQAAIADQLSCFRVKRSLIAGLEARRDAERIRSERQVATQAQGPVAAVPVRKTYARDPRGRGRRDGRTLFGGIAMANGSQTRAG